MVLIFFLEWVLHFSIVHILSEHILSACFHCECSKSQRGTKSYSAMFIPFDTWGNKGGHKTIFTHSQSLENGIHRYFYRVRVFERQIRKGWNYSGLREGDRALPTQTLGFCGTIENILGSSAWNLRILSSFPGLNRKNKGRSSVTCQRERGPVSNQDWHHRRWFVLLLSHQPPGHWAFTYQID